MQTQAEIVKNITIRPMEVEDISDVMEIDRKTTGLQRAVTYRDQVNVYLGGELSLSYVAEVDDKVVGFMMGRIRNLRHGIYEGAWLEMVGVDPAYKRRGVGKRLLEAFQEGCQRKSAKVIHIVVDSADPEIKPFVESFGFRAGPQIHMQKRL